MEDTESCSSRVFFCGWNQNQNRKQRQKVEVYNEVLSRLRELNVPEAVVPGFEDELWAHFYRLPTRYALDMNVKRAQDVLMHKRLLHMARTPPATATGPAVEVRLVQVHSAFGVSCSKSFHSNSQSKVSPQDSGISGNMRFHPPPAFSSSANAELALGASQLQVCNRDNYLNFYAHYARPMHEITISTNDKPKLLSQLTSLLSETGLDIQEAHAFSTLDGYSLDVFVVGGWAVEETEKLKHVLAKKIQKLEKQSRVKENGSVSLAEQDQTGMNFISRHVIFATCGNDALKSDARCLRYENKIASGPFSDLYKGTFCNQDVAIKVLKQENLNENIQREFAQEVYILSKIQHKNVVKFVGARTKPPNLYLVTEYLSGGSMYDLLHMQKAVFALPSLLKVAIDVSEGMKYLHQNDIIHRDLKTANLLMDENGVVKVADFGVARVHDQSGIMTAETGTYRWMAPEVIEHKPYDHKADVFSFAIVLWELITGKIHCYWLDYFRKLKQVLHRSFQPMLTTLSQMGKIQNLVEGRVRNDSFSGLELLLWLLGIHTFHPCFMTECQLPYEHLSPLQAAVGVVQKGLRPKIPRHTHPKLVELLQWCWHQDPSVRPNFSEILEFLLHMTNMITGKCEGKGNA